MNNRQKFILTVSIVFTTLVLFEYGLIMLPFLLVVLGIPTYFLYKIWADKTDYRNSKIEADKRRETNKGLKENLKYCIKGMLYTFVASLTTYVSFQLIPDKGFLSLVKAVFGGSLVLWGIGFVFCIAMFPLSFIWWFIERNRKN